MPKPQQMLANTIGGVLSFSGWKGKEGKGIPSLLASAVVWSSYYNPTAHYWRRRLEKVIEVAASPLPTGVEAAGGYAWHGICRRTSQGPWKWVINTTTNGGSQTPACEWFSDTCMRVTHSCSCSEDVRRRKQLLKFLGLPPRFRPIYLAVLIFFFYFVAVRCLEEEKNV